MYDENRSLKKKDNNVFSLKIFSYFPTEATTLESEIVVPGTFIKFSDFSHQYFLILAGMFINLVIIRSCNIENQPFS